LIDVGESSKVKTRIETHNRKDYWEKNCNVTVKYVVYYRILYVAGFFIASFMDTTIVWTFSGIAIAMMTLPNLFGILMLRKEMKTTVKQYWDDFQETNLNDKVLK